MAQKHFFDIGGNIGQTFDWLATLPHDYSDHTMWVFEPSPRHFAKLIAKCREMSPKYTIKLCPFGLGGKTETLTFFEKDDDKGDSFQSWLASDHEVKNITQGYEVVASMVSLPDFILRSTNDGDDIVLDIDAEGSEYAMLDSLLKNLDALQRVREIYVEFHFIKDMDPKREKETLCEALSSHNITVHTRGSV